MSLVINPQTVPEFSLQPENILIVESNTEVEVCIILMGSGMLGRSVEVTAETGPKNGVLNQATGIRLIGRGP